VEVEASTEIDDRIARQILDATGREPRLEVVEPAGRENLTADNADNADWTDER
jgi:hypothetical protein